MKKKNLLTLFTAAFVALMPLAAKSKKAIITERPERMMWQIKAPNGTEINILGTIHITDEETNSSLEPSVEKLVEESDFVYGELAYKDLKDCVKQVQKLILTDKPRDKNKKRIFAKDYLSEDELKTMTTIIERSLGEKSTQYFINSMLRLPPWSLNSMIQADVYKKCGVSAENGIDFIIYKIAAINDLKVQGLDKIEDQIKMLHFGSTEDQILILKTNLSEYKEDPDKNKNTLLDMIAAYKKDDRNALKEILDRSFTEDLENEKLAGLSKDYLKKYINALLTKRNRKWAKQIKKMLKTKNKKYFIFTGAAHWLGQDNVFDLLIKQGVAERQ